MSSGPKDSPRGLILGVSEREFLEGMGVYFVSFVGHYGYDRVLSVLGRHMRDFLNGLDNLHEYLKFSYPRMKAPSFFCERETPSGLTLHYRSARRGFLWYTIGQIKEVGHHFYNTDVDVHVLQQTSSVGVYHVILQLSFDNRAFRLEEKRKTLRIDRTMLPIKAFLFLEIFPFCLVFDSHLHIKTIGKSLRAIMPDITGRRLPEVFDLTRPLIECTWEAGVPVLRNIDGSNLQKVNAKGKVRKFSWGAFRSLSSDVTNVSMYLMLMWKNKVVSYL
ncbi:soluble guanylate cyclase 88E [Trichonephila clavipes]|nr:soluble guanylate cyclase 88E [Trichonephila clavipes]